MNNSADQWGRREVRPSQGELKGMIHRREFITGLGATATSAAIGLNSSAGAAEPPPETITLRLQRPVKTLPGMCVAPQLVADDLLKLEGFTDVRYVATDTPQRAAGLAGGEIDLSMGFVGGWIKQVDAGDPIVMLTGVHVGCYELFAAERIRTIGDLRGKTIGVTELGSSRHLFLVSVLSYVGLNPNKDVTFVTKPQAESVKLFAEGKLDAYQAFSEEVQELRKRKIGHVIMSSTEERPWSQYFCCMLAGNREFVRARPVATKRAVRAILKASSVCALEAGPRRALRRGARLHHGAVRVCPQHHQKPALHEVAGVRPRGYGPLLHAPSSRGGNSKVDPAEDPRSGHRLGLPERVEEGAEGIGAEMTVKVRKEMPTLQ